MKTAHEILLEVVRLKDSPDTHEPKQLLELLADLARVVMELEQGGDRGAKTPSREPESAGSTQEQAAP